MILDPDHSDDAHRRRDDTVINYRLDEMKQDIKDLTTEVKNFSTGNQWINSEVFRVTIEQLTGFIGAIQLEYRTDIKDLKDDLKAYQDRQGRLWLGILGSFIAPFLLSILLYVILGTK